MAESLVDKDKYMIGGETSEDGSRPFGGTYFHVVDNAQHVNENRERTLPSSLRLMLIDYADEIWSEAIKTRSLKEKRGDTYAMFDGEKITIIFTLLTSEFGDDAKYAIELAQEQLEDVDIEDKFNVKVVDELDVPANGEVFNLDKNHLTERKLTIKECNRLMKCLNEEVVADGSAEHNPYAQQWKIEREDLKNFISKYGKLMTSKENGKTYKVYFDKTMSELIGHNYCVCMQYDQLSMKPTSSIVYIRALDKFTERMFQAQFDDRGRDNMRGTIDDANYNSAYYGA